jgi:predicted KAP-like P-loop ATPase
MTDSQARPDLPISELASDRPIESQTQDRLGRAPFADNLATAIAGWKESDSLVIALYGEWGIGKSSIKNLVLEQLRAHGRESPDVVQFNPWQWTGHQDLSAAFFRDVLAVLEGKSEKDTQQVTRTLRRYAAYLGVIKVVLGGPKGFLALALAVFGVLSLAPPFFLTSAHAVVLAKIVGSAALAVAALVYWGEQLLEKLATWLDLSGSGARTLEERKRDVVSSLKNYKRTLLVVVDDVDRLTAKEIQAVFQLIKANADFPRFVYLVMFQRNIVERALAELTKESGSEFLEKIVQVGFDVPQPRQDEVDELLFEGIGRVLGSSGSERVNQTYWGNIYYGSLRAYFRDLRDIKRFLASFEFPANLLRTGGTLDINPVDLIAIEALRLFDPDIYTMIRRNKALLTGSRSSDADDKRRVAGDIKKLLGGLSEDRSDTATGLLKNLFPSTTFAFGGMSYSSRSAVDWDRDLRVCTPSFFDRYFQLSLSKEEISQFEVELLLAASSDTAALTKELERLSGEGKLVTALDRLDVNKDHIPPENTVAALTALFDIGERLPEPKPGAFSGPESTICRIGYQLLKREPEVDRAAKLEAVLKAVMGLRISILFLGTNCTPPDRQQGTGDILIADVEVPRMQDLGLQKIRRVAMEGRLLNRSDLVYLLFRWRQWAGDEEAQRWSRDTTKDSPQRTLGFLRPFLHQGTSHTIGDHVARINYFIKYSEIEHFVDVYELEKDIDKLSEVRLTDLDQKVVQEFRKAVARKRSGKVEGDWGWDSE